MYENYQNPPPPTSPESEKCSLRVFELPAGQFMATTVGGGRCVFISVLLQQDLTPWGPGRPGTHCGRLG